MTEPADVPVASDAPTVDVRLAQLRADFDRAREILRAGVLAAHADQVRIVFTPAQAAEFFTLLGVRPDEELC